MPQMDTYDLIKRYGELREDASERYLNGMLSFFKWTTTFTFALIIWIGTNIQNQLYESSWLFLSIIFIIGSIIIAIITTHLILDLWNKDWRLKFQIHQLLINYDMNERQPSPVAKEELEKQRKLVLDSSKQLFELKRFDRYLILHIVALLIGTIFYLFAIYL